MSKTYQTVIYHKPTGAILLVTPNLYISSRRMLARLVHRPHWNDIAFLYFAYDISIDLGKHLVRFLSPGFPASLVTKDGVPVDYSIKLSAQKVLLNKGGNFLVFFKAGMGDQLFEAAALLTAQDTYKDVRFSIQVEKEYLSIMNHVSGLPPIQTAYVGQAAKSFNHKVSNDTMYVSDPRPSMPGKPSLYGTFLGLHSVNKLVKIKLTKADYTAESSLFGSLPLDKVKLNFAIHFHSRSGHGKNWDIKNVIELSELLHSSFDCNVIVLGVERPVPKPIPGIIDLTGKTNWFQTCLIVSLVDLVICIDSGVLHIARSLGTPYIALWGGTTPRFILGTEDPEHDIVSVIPDKPRGSHQSGDNIDHYINQITPAMVLKKISKVLNSKDSQAK
ncbi:hypothetical protein ES702_02942 [subsurface metagenome]